jgi:hypothetical protein
LSTSRAEELLVPVIKTLNEKSTEALTCNAELQS